MFAVTKFSTGLDRAFDEALTMVGRRGFALGYDAKAKTPSNIYHSDSGSTIEVPMTGIPRENIKIELVGRVLTVTGKVERTELDGKELKHGKLSRRDVKMTFSLPEGCTAENVTSKLENGLLTIEVSNPTVEEPKQKAIAIEIK
jgi:HSP20 family molecular chaperone IbpA